MVSSKKVAVTWAASAQFQIGAAEIARCPEISARQY